MNIEREVLQKQIEKELCSGTEFAHPATRRFVRAVVLDGTVERYLNQQSLKPVTFKARERAYRMAIIFFGSSATLEQVKEIYGNGVSSERTRQLIAWTINGLHKNSTPLTRYRSPLDKIPKNKYGQANNLIGRGLWAGREIAQVAASARSGASYGEIVASAGHHIINIARSHYKRVGVDIPYSERRVISREIRRQMRDENLTYEQVKGLWAKTSLGIAHNSLTKEGLTLSLNDLAGYAGLHIRALEVTLLLPYLEKAGIAWGEYHRSTKTKDGKTLAHSYYLIRAADLEKAIQALKEAGELKPFFENPVKLISAAEGFRTPTTTILLNRRGFAGLNNLFQEHGLNIRTLPLPVELFIRYCPYPVYRYANSNTFYYPVKFERQIRTYIKRTAKRLGIKTGKRATE